MGNDRKDKGRIKIEAKSILGDDRKDRKNIIYFFKKKEKNIREYKRALKE